MVAVLLGFVKTPWNDEIAWNIFFVACSSARFFSYVICAACNSFLPTSACSNFFFKKKNLCVIQHAASKNNRAYLLRTEITKSHLNNHICQHRGMKTSSVTPYFYYVFNISLYCNDTIPSFIGNLWRVLLLGNYLKSKYHCNKQIGQKSFLCQFVIYQNKNSFNILVNKSGKKVNFLFT